MRNTGQQVRGVEYLEVTWTPNEDMEYFDALPVAIRQALNYAPGRYSARDIRQFVEARGEVYTLMCLKEMNAQVLRQAERERQWTR